MKILSGLTSTIHQLTSVVIALLGLGIVVALLGGNVPFLDGVAANKGNADFVGIGRSIALHLGEIKRHSGHAPGISPALHQGLHPGRVDPAIPAIAGSLAPDRSTDSVGNDRRNLAIEELRRTTPHTGNPGKLRPGRPPPSCRCHSAGLFLPGRQVRVVALIGLAALVGERIRIANKPGIRSELRMLLDRLALGEGFDAGIAVGAEQDADRNLQLLVELVGKSKGQG